MTKLRYRNALRALLTPAEQRVFARLDTPQKIQTFLDRLPANYELDGDTAMSPRRMLQTRIAHCAEGALFAAAVLSFHGKRAWLMDIQALPSDQDHIVALFKERGLWGAISKTNHAILRWRDPIYRSAARTGDELRTRILPAGRQEIDADIFAAIFAGALCAQALGDRVRRSALADGRARRFAASCRWRRRGRCANGGAPRGSSCSRKRCWNGPTRASARPGPKPNPRPNPSVTSRAGPDVYRVGTCV